MKYRVLSTFSKNKNLQKEYLIVSMNSLRNSSRLAGGISSTLLDSPFGWRKIFWQVYIYVCLRSGIFVFLVINKDDSLSLQEERIVASSPQFFFHSDQENPVFSSACMFGYHVDVKTFAPLIGRTIHTHCRSAFLLVSWEFHKNFTRPFCCG